MIKKRRILWVVAVIAAVFSSAAFTAFVVKAAPTCFLAEHSDVICPRSDVPEPGENRPYIPGKSDPDRRGGPGDVDGPIITIPGIGDCEGREPFEVFTSNAMSREGYSNKVYLDSQGIPTVGIGHRVVPDDHLNVGDEISDDRVMELWRQDSAAAFNAAINQAREAGICDPCFIAALGGVSFQLGAQWTTKFPAIWALIVAGQYQEAADALSATAWASQTPTRVRDFQAALRALPPKPPSCTIQPGVPGNPVYPRPKCTTLGWLSGAYEPRPGFEALRSDNPAKSNICTTFTKDSATWAGLGNASDGSVRTWLDGGCKNLVVSIRTFPSSAEFTANSCAQNYRRVANGEFDDYYKAIALNLKNAGVPANAIFRFGWELNSNQPWGLSGCRTAADAQTFIEGYRHIVDIFRLNFGDTFSVSWNFLKQASTLPMSIDTYYPGDDYVDYVGIDYSDANPPAATQEEFDAFANQGTLAVPMGINTWTAYAQSKGKVIAVDQWGVMPRANGGLGDNPAYIEAMYGWFQLHACQLGYESYFNGAGSGQALDTGENSGAASKYASLWGRSEEDTDKTPPNCGCKPITEPPPAPALPVSCACNPPRPGGLLGGTGQANVGVSFDVYHQFESRTWSCLSRGCAINDVASHINAALAANPDCNIWGVISYPGLPSKARENGVLEDCVAGQFHNYHRQYGASLKAAGLTDKIILRIGWEWDANTNGNMSAGPDTDIPRARLYAACFRNIVTDIRAGCDGCNILFDFNSTTGIKGRTGMLDAGYPGDDYVDIVSVEGYDNRGPQPPNYQGRWDTMADIFDYVRDFAAAHGKYTAFPEWAIINCAIDPAGCRSMSINGGGDNALFIKNMCERARDPANRVFYFTYFGGKPDTYPWHSLENPMNAASRAAFIQYCGCGP